MTHCQLPPQIWKMNPAWKRGLKRIAKIFTNKQEEAYNRRPPVEEGGQPPLLEEVTNNSTQPIYFDELSLSKFIEDYLDYQIDYAHQELSKLNSDAPLSHGISGVYSLRDEDNNQKEVNFKNSNEGLL